VTVGRQLLIASAVLLLIAAVDFTRRIYVPRDEALRSYAPPQVAALPPPPDLAAVRAQLENWLPALPASRPPDLAARGPDSWDLKLVGTFEQRRQRFAVIMATPRSGGKAERRRVAVGDVVYGRTVTGIGRGSLALSAPTGVEELKVFGPHHRTN
jgi:hypothetical protein